MDTRVIREPCSPTTEPTNLTDRTTATANAATTAADDAETVVIHEAAADTAIQGTINFSCVVAKLEAS